MPPDNVTPFRPRRPAPKPQGPQSGGIHSHRGKAILVQALALAAFTIAAFIPYLPLILGLAAALIAFSSRGESMPWANTHHEHVIRTVIIGMVIGLVLQMPLLFAKYLPPQVLTGLGYAQLALLAWVVIRTGVGVVLAILRRPIWHPKGVLL